MLYLKQSTTTTIRMGPFVDKTDGVTPETALSPSVKVSKNGGVFAARNSATAITHDTDGYYSVELNGTDTNTLGRLQVVATDSANHLAVYHEFTILVANVFDSLIGNTDLLLVDVSQLDGSSTGAQGLEAAAEGSVPGTCAAGSTNTTINTNLTEATDNHYNGRVIVFRAGALAGQGLLITAYNGTTKALTVQNVTNDAPANTDAFVIV